MNLNTREQSSSRDEGKESGNSSSKNMRHASPAEVEKYLKGVRFPANKKELLNQAKNNNAPKEVTGLLEQVGDKDYNNIADVSKEIGRLEG